MRVLLLDENEIDLQKTETLLLEKSDIEVISLNSADELEIFLSQSKIDIIVCELYVGFVSIMEIIAIAKRFNQIPVIGCSYGMSELSVIQFLEDGLSDFVSKTHLNRLPFSVLRSYNELKTRRELDRSVEQLNNVLKSKMSLIKNIPGAVYRCTNKNNWHPQFMSEQCESVTGYSFEYFHDHGFEHIIHPDDLPNVHATIDKAVETRTNYEVEYRLFNKDGSIRIIWEKGNAVYNLEGYIEALEGVIIDVTKNKRRENLISKINNTVNIEAGEKYFSKLTDFLHTNIGSKVVMVGRYLEELNSVQSTSFRINGEETKNITYSLKNTPCSNVLQKAMCVYEENVRAQFPLDHDLVDLNAESFIGVPIYNIANNPIGLVVLIDDKPLTEREEKETILRLVATRAGTEMERLATELELKLSEEKYRKVVENQSEMIIRWRVSGRIIFANQSYLRYFNMTFDELATKSYYNSITDTNRLEQKIQSLNPQNPSAIDVHFSIRPDGEKAWYEWTDVAFFNDEGIIIEIQSTGRDVTKKRIAQLAIIEEKEKLSKYLNTTPSVFLLLNTKGYVEMINQKGCDLLEYQDTEILGKNWFDHFIPINARRTSKRIFLSNIENEKSPMSYRESFIQTRSGNQILVAWNNTYIFNSEGNITGVLSSGVDITRQKLTLENLSISESQLKKAQRITKTGSFEIVPGKNERTWSDEMYNIFEVDTKEFIPSLDSITELVLPADRHIHAGMLINMRSGYNPGSIEYRIKTKSGNIKYIQSSGDLQLDEAGRVQKIIGTAQDITELKLAERAIKEKEEFTHSVFSAIDDSIVVINNAGIILKTNKKWKEFALNNNGALEKTDIGCNYLEVCQKSSKAGDQLAAKVLDGIQSILSKQKSTFELEYPCHSVSQKRWFMMRATPFTGEDGGVVIMHMDITEKKLKELDLHASYQEIIHTEKINYALVHGESSATIAGLVLRGLIESTGVERGRIYLYDKKNHGLILYAEFLPEKLKKYLEKKWGAVDLSTQIPKLIAGSKFNDAITNRKTILTNDTAEIKELIAEHASNLFIKQLSSWTNKLIGIKTFGLYPLIHGEDVVGLLSISASAALNVSDTNSIYRFAQHASLVLSRQLDQEALIKSEEKFKAISNYTANWETWIDTSGKPIWLNPAVQIHSGYTPTELLEMQDFYKEIIHVEDYPLVLSTLVNALTNKTEGENLETRVNHKNGSTPWFSISWKQVYDKDGNWVGIRTSGFDITERKIQQKELMQRTNQLKAAHAIAKLGTWKWIISENNFYMNDLLCEIIHLPVNKNVLSKDELFAMMHPESHDRLKESFYNAIHDFKSKDIEIRMNSLSGEDIYLLIRAETPKEGAVKNFIQGTASDITELKKSYIEAKLNHEKFEKIFNSIQDVYYQTNAAGIISLVSPSVHELLGYASNELLGKSISFLYAKPSFAELKKAKNHVQGLSEQFEATLISKQGEEIIVSINLSFVNEPNENQGVVHGIMRNITEKKRQELNLENQRKRLLEIVKLNTQIIETSDHFYYVIDIAQSTKKSSHLKYVSPQVLQFTGVNEIEILKHANHWNEYVVKEDRKLLKNHSNEVLSQKTPQLISYQIKNIQTGELIWVDDYACPLLNENNEIIEIYGSVKNVTERVNSILKITTEKKQSIAYQYQLLSSQLNPHFIYNTLNSFQYYILQGDVETSLNHISDFSKLMRQVLENSSARYISLEEEIVFLEQYFAISKQRMPQEVNFTIESFPEVETNELLIPPMLLQPYLENAIIHAFVECPRQPAIKLTIKKNGDKIECCIEDNGVGRQKSFDQKKKNSGRYKSYAIGINSDRIDLLNQMNPSAYDLKIDDLFEETGETAGTRVTITFNSIYSSFAELD